MYLADMDICTKLRKLYKKKGVAIFFCGPCCLALPDFRFRRIVAFVFTIIQGDVGVAERAATALLTVDPRDAAAHVVLANTYSAAGMHSKSSALRAKMSELHIKKIPGIFTITTHFNECY